MKDYDLISENKRYKYYHKDGKLYRKSKNTMIEIGYIDDNLRLYKRLCESI